MFVTPNTTTQGNSYYKPALPILAREEYFMDKEKQREYFRRKYEEAKPAYEALMTCYPFTLDDLPGEIWKDIDGYSGVYQISTFGRVKSFWGKEPLILKPVLVGEYLSVNLCGNGKMKQRTIHSLVAKAFIPNPLKKPEVNHDDGHKLNCHISNLYWATTAENQQHALKNGLRKSGVENSCAKIKSETDIIYIRDNPDNLTIYELAEKYVVDPTTIGLIQLGKTHKNEGGTIRGKQKGGAKSKITDEIREQIRADWATGLYTKIALAHKFGYGRETIRKIINESA